jgi:hypothetical protein
MENKNKPETKKKYSVDELVLIGDHIHNSSASFVVCLNDLDDVDMKKSVFFSSHGYQDDIVTLFTQIIEKNPRIENLLIEAIATYNILNADKKIKDE